MAEYHRRTGERLTYEKLSERTGMSVSAFKKIGGKLDKHTTLANVEKICMALDSTPGDLLVIIPDPPEPESESVSESEPNPKKAKKKKKTTKKKKKKTTKKKK